MAWGETDGKYIAFPTVVEIRGKLVDLTQKKGKDPAEYAIKNGEYIEFDTREEAEAFADGAWKEYWYDSGILERPQEETSQGKKQIPNF